MTNKIENKQLQANLDSLPSTDQKNAMDNANNPTSANPFATIDDLSAANPTILNTVQKFVSPVGNDAYNGQIDRKKLTIEAALASMDGQSSADVDLEDGSYAEALIFGTTRSRRTVRGTKGSDRVVITRTWTFNGNCQQACLTDLKFDNATGYCLDIGSTLSNFKFDGMNVGGSVTDTVFMRVRAGGSGFITLVNCDLTNKIIQLDNTATPRFFYMNNCVNAVLNAGTGWIVIKGINCQNVFEASANNNVLAGWMANAVLSSHSEYLAVVALGAAGNGYYLCNYTEAGVFSTGDVILRNNPATIVDSKYYNANVVYYVVSTFKSYFKRSGTWNEMASITDTVVPETNLAKFDWNLGNDTTGAVNNISKPFKTMDAILDAIVAAGGVTPSNPFVMHFAQGAQNIVKLGAMPFITYTSESVLGAQLTGDLLVDTDFGSASFVNNWVGFTGLTITSGSTFNFDLNSIGGLANNATNVYISDCMIQCSTSFLGRRYTTVTPDKFYINGGMSVSAIEQDCGTFYTDNHDAGFSDLTVSANLGNTAAYINTSKFNSITIDGAGSYQNVTTLIGVSSGTITIQGANVTVNMDAYTYANATIVVDPSLKSKINIIDGVYEENTVFVDAVKGSDAKALPGYANFPYATELTALLELPTAAQDDPCKIIINSGKHELADFVLSNNVFIDATGAFIAADPNAGICLFSADGSFDAANSQAYINNLSTDQPFQISLNGYSAAGNSTITLPNLKHYATSFLFSFVGRSGGTIPDKIVLGGFVKANMQISDAEILLLEGFSNSGKLLDILDGGSTCHLTATNVQFGALKVREGATATVTNCTFDGASGETYYINVDGATSYLYIDEYTYDIVNGLGKVSLTNGATTSNIIFTSIHDVANSENKVYVNVAGDLPTPLAVNTEYVILNNISVAQRAIPATAGVYKISSPYNKTITFTNNGAGISGSGLLTGTNIILDGVKMVNTTSGGIPSSIFSLSSTSGNQVTLWVNNNCSFTAPKLGVFSYLNVMLRNSALNSASSSGLEFQNCGRVYFKNNNLAGINTAGSILSFTSGTPTALIADNYGAIPAAAEFLNIASATSSGNYIVSNNDVLGNAATMFNIASGGLDEHYNAVNALNNVGYYDSIVRADGGLASNATATTITTADTYYAISGTWSSAYEQRGTVSSAGAFTYIGKSPIIANVQALLTLTAQSDDATAYSFALFKNGTIVANTTSIITGNNSIMPQQVLVLGTIPLVTNDVVTVRVTTPDGSGRTITIGTARMIVERCL